jgi:hypothetical protein
LYLPNICIGIGNIFVNLLAAIPFHKNPDAESGGKKQESG